MSRIRTIKPGFFKHERLYDAELETALPLRLAFAGLWTVADREGRFAWRPRSLKTDVLPYDDVDFSRVLDALATRGFIVRYTVGDEAFAFIPNWAKHQVVNNREAGSTLPPPPETVEEFDASSTREPRDTETHVQDQGEGKGREQEGKGKERGGADAQTGFAFVGKVIRLKIADFDKWRAAYPGVPDFIAELTKADDYYAENPLDDGKWFFPVSRWLAKVHEEASKATGTHGGTVVLDKHGNRPGDPYYGVDY